ncbi:GAP family protein [Kocuria sp. BT304]|uniref:GAP family protein n=1 Tax=Kocuria sp. BT304 TaxID=1702043 RepID=UPI000DD46B36|nr:GAP family protein [Kocuria sp. BT304]
MTLETLLAVLGLALLDSLSPAVIGITLYLLLTAPRRLSLLLGAYLATVATAYFVLGVLLMLGLGAIVPAIDPSVRAWLQAALGIGLFLGSWYVPPQPSRRPREPRALTVTAMITFGLGTWLFEFATAVPYFAAIGIMTAARSDPVHWLPLLAVYVVIMLLPGIVLYVGWLVLGDRARGRFGQWQTKLENGSHATISWIMGVAGVLIFLNALSSLPLPLPH